MGHEAMQTVTAIVTAIIGLAVLAVLLNSSGTGVAMASTLSRGLAADIGAATAPVMGGAAGGMGMGMMGGLGMMPMSGSFQYA